MSAFRLRILVVVLCIALLCGCAADNTNKQENTPDNTPATENTAPTPDTEQDNAPDENTDTAPDEESEETVEIVAELDVSELIEWSEFFCLSENNGLLRFPYEDAAADPDQLAPYLGTLFYDMGEGEEQISEEEFDMLLQEGVSPEALELDTFRLSRDYLNTYLGDKFNISADKTENLLDAAQLGTYLMWYDAWYVIHSDCAYAPYSIDHGVRLADGTIKLYYYNDFLSIMQENGEMDYISSDMIITLAQREDGSWYIVSHEIDTIGW